MIVSADELAALQRRVVMVDGGFDPIHEGHVRYFAAAARLGHPVLCNVSPDSWVARKHAPLLSQLQRAEVVAAFRDIHYVHIGQGETVEVLRMLRPRAYVKGEDWRHRLPLAEQALCREHGIDIVFVETVSSSSSALLAAYCTRQRGV